MKLSILICTVPSRVRSFLPKIITSLEKQLPKKDVEILYFGDNKMRSIGEKRNDLLRLAQGEYVVFVDDDDRVEPDYIPQILHAIQSNADVICFDVMCSIGGHGAKVVKYDAKFPMDRDCKEHYERLPNHIMCIKKELAIKVGFPDKSFAEDQDFAKRLRPLIKRQARIKKVLYWYDFSHATSEVQ